MDSIVFTSSKTTSIGVFSLDNGVICVRSNPWLSMLGDEMSDPMKPSRAEELRFATTPTYSSTGFKHYLLKQLNKLKRLTKNEINRLDLL